MQGAAALYLQHLKLKKADQALIDAFITRSTPTKSSYANQVIDPIAAQGAGIIDAYAAAFQEGIIRPGFLLLNDTEHFDRTHSIKSAPQSDGSL